MLEGTRVDVEVADELHNAAYDLRDQRDKKDQGDQQEGKDRAKNRKVAAQTLRRYIRKKVLLVDIHQRVKDIGDDRGENNREQKGSHAAQSAPDDVQMRQDREEDYRGAGCDRVCYPGGVEIVFIKWFHCVNPSEALLQKRQLNVPNL